jgi:hypothetical protein
MIELVEAVMVVFPCMHMEYHSDYNYNHQYCHHDSSSASTDDDDDDGVHSVSIYCIIVYIHILVEEYTSS